MGIKRFAKSVGAGALIAASGELTRNCINKLNLDPPDQYMDFDKVKGLEGMLTWAGYNISALAGDNGQNLVALGVATAAAVGYHLCRKYADKHDY